MKELLQKGKCLTNFISNYENLLNRWPADQKMNYKEIAKQTKTELPLIMEFLSDTLINATDIHEPLSFKEAKKSFQLLKHKMSCLLEEYKKLLEKYQIASKECYENMLEHQNQLESNGKFYQAYKNLGYFFGMNEKFLDRATSIEICNKLLRLGIESKVNFQELTKWINKGIDIYLTEENDILPSLEGAVCFVDNYKQYLILSDKNKGEHFINSMLDKIQTLASMRGLIQPLVEEEEEYPELDMAS